MSLIFYGPKHKLADALKRPKYPSPARPRRWLDLFGQLTVWLGDLKPGSVAYNEPAKAFYREVSRRRRADLP